MLTDEQRLIEFSNSITDSVGENLITRRLPFLRPLRQALTVTADPLLR